MSVKDLSTGQLNTDKSKQTDKREVEPLDSKLKDSLSNYIARNYNTPYITQDEKSRVDEEMLINLAVKHEKEIEKKEEEKSEEAEGKIIVRYSLPSSDELEGLSRHAEAFATYRERFVEPMSFIECLRLYMIKSGMDNNAEIYKKANLSRSLFSSILSNRHIPKKNTIVALAIALRLDLRETERLLMKAGYTFSNSIKADLIAVYFIDHKIYDIDKLNRALHENGEPVLGSRSQ